MREIKLFVAGAKVGERSNTRSGHCRVGGGLVDLVQHHDGLQPQRQRLGCHELGLRHRAFGGIDQQADAIDHRQDALDLAAEIGVAGVSTILMRVPSIRPRWPWQGMVMPRSRSMSLLSITRSATA